jgi:outer membrane protein assembly factor BamB
MKKIFVFVLALLFACSAQATDWPMFHFNSSRTGFTPDTRAVTNAQIWSRSMGGPMDQLSPAVYNGRVYVAPMGNTIYALNATTGTTNWSYSTGGMMNQFSPATVSGGKVYISSMDGNTYAVDATTGALNWSYPAGGGMSSPAVSDGIVYIGIGVDLYAVNASTGAFIWNYDIDPAWSIDFSPAVSGGIVYVSSTSHLMPPPQINDNIYAINASTGAFIWNYTTNDRVASSPAVSNGVVYVASGSQNVYALNATDGSFIWSHLPGGSVAMFMMRSSPAVADGRVYFGAEDNKVYSLDASTGALNWSYTTGNMVESSPAVSGGIVYVGSDDGKVYALNATTGALKWSRSTGSTIGSSSPAISDGLLYITSGGTVRCLGALPDFTSPVVSSVSPAEVTVGLQRQFNVIVTDNVGLSSCSFFWNGENVSLMTRVTGNSSNGTWAANYTPTQIGSFSAWANCSDTSGNTAKTSTSINVVAPSGTATDWPTFHFNSARTGTTPDAGPTTNSLLWSFATGNQLEYSSPAVSDGIVYAGPADDGTLYAIDALNGSLIWSQFTTGTIYSSPVIADGMIYTNINFDIRAFNMSDGGLVWNYTTGSDIWDNPAVSDGRVYFGSNDNNFYALNATDGSFMWSYPLGGSVTKAPAVSDGIVYFGASDNNFYALNATDGSFIWNYPTDGGARASPAVSDGRAYVMSFNTITWSLKVTALNATTGGFIWTVSLGAGATDVTPAVANGRVYLSDLMNLKALNATTGAAIWSYSPVNSIDSSPAVAGGMVYFGANNGKIYAIDEVTGAPVWTYTTGMQIWSSPAIWGGMLYVGSNDFSVYAIGTLPPDTTPPSISAVTRDTVLNNTIVEFNVTATDDTAVTACDLYWDGINVSSMTNIGGDVWAANYTVSEASSHYAWANCTDGTNTNSTNTIMTVNTLPEGFTYSQDYDGAADPGDYTATFRGTIPESYDAANGTYLAFPAFSNGWLQVRLDMPAGVTSGTLAVFKYNGTDTTQMTSGTYGESNKYNVTDGYIYINVTGGDPDFGGVGPVGGGTPGGAGTAFAAPEMSALMVAAIFLLAAAATLLIKRD